MIAVHSPRKRRSVGAATAGSVGSLCSCVSDPETASVDGAGDHRDVCNGVRVRSADPGTDRWRRTADNRNHGIQPWFPRCGDALVFRACPDSVRDGSRLSAQVQRNRRRRMPFLPTGLGQRHHRVRTGRLSRQRRALAGADIRVHARQLPAPLAQHARIVEHRQDCRNNDRQLALPGPIPRFGCRSLTRFRRCQLRFDDHSNGCVWGNLRNHGRTVLLDQRQRPAQMGSRPRPYQRHRLVCRHLCRHRLRDRLGRPSVRLGLRSRSRLGVLQARQQTTPRLSH